ncbi:ATP synthase, F1 gamma subunit [Xenococcus sp. PCC 7305]|uniref:F0F1 ATP synthase subunit gamma n=1 Tax=Xenococcus sp. PCC 7305 TaxID=102125 RepID=UPI0002ABEB76|nr:F0F1 ATP synthase subunit gamma [Xenococcus sp. PCC 7305]ELS04502.1 ATP synthase, F1 gamma subunit [Xenococcus sp. PCC 7305]
MANLKAIRDRIKTVKNTKKITEAMRLVAAAKVRRAQEQVLAGRPFADSLAQMLYLLRSYIRFEEAGLELLLEREVKTVGLIVVSSDRGLCGGYNTSVIRRAEERAQEVKASGLDYQYILIGRKAIQYFQNRNQPIAYTYDGLEQVPTAPEASLIQDGLRSLYLSGKIDRGELIYTKFVSLISSRPVLQTLYPLDPTKLIPDGETLRLITQEGKLQVQVEREEVQIVEEGIKAQLILEQNPAQLLDSLLPLYILNQLLRALQESAASELAARMNAMSNASENATELIGSLTLSYNKARQAAITQELLEVVAGAEGLR